MRCGARFRGQIDEHRPIAEILCPKCAANRCPKCGGEMAAGYHMIRTLDGASVIMVYDDNLKHAEDALLSTDARRHVEGVRILRAVRDRINAQAEAWMEVVLKCNCGHEEKVR